MNASVYKKIESIIAIPFVEDEVATASVCFACSEELRADFRIQFSAMDVVNYVYGIIHEMYQTEEFKAKAILDLKIPFPQSALDFWKYSLCGKKIRFESTMKELEALEFSKFNWY